MLLREAVRVLLIAFLAACLIPHAEAGIGKIYAVINSLFGGSIDASAATTGQVLTKQADGSWAGAAAGGGDLATVLASGATTGGTDLVVTNGDSILFDDGVDNSQGIMCPLDGFLRLTDGSNTSGLQLGRQIQLMDPGATKTLFMARGSSNAVDIASDWQYRWSDDTTDVTTLDTGLERISAGVVGATDGSTGEGVFYAGSGDSANPAYTIGDANSGIYSVVAGTTIDVLLNGAQKHSFSGTQIRATADGVAQSGYNYMVNVDTDGETLNAVTEKGEWYTNTGAVAEVVFTLESIPEAGEWFGFMCADVDGIRVSIDASDNVIWSGGTTTTGKGLYTVGLGASLKLVAINTTTWFAVHEQGTWTEIP